MDDVMGECFGDLESAESFAGLEDADSFMGAPDVPGILSSIFGTWLEAIDAPSSITTRSVTWTSVAPRRSRFHCTTSPRAS